MRNSTKFATALGACLLGTAVFFRIRYRNKVLKGFSVSVLLERFSNTPILAPHHYRNVFNNTPNAPLACRQNHTHSTAAARRTQGSHTTRHIAQGLGLNPFFYQMSLSDQRGGHQGSRSWFWTKDLTSQPRKHDPRSDELVIMVDVDHYVDMPRILANEFRPRVIRTFQPNSVADVSDDLSFTFDNNNNVHFQVAGGGGYSHPVWSYQQDSVCATTWWYGIYPVSSHYLIDRRENGPHHELILLTPVRQFTGLSALISLFTIKSQPLNRLQPNGGTFNSLNVRRKNREHDVSVGYPMDYSSVTVTREELDAILSTALVLKNDITAPTVESQLATDNNRDRTYLKHAGALLASYARQINPPKPPFVFPVEDAVRGYQYGKYEPDAPQILTPFMAPMMHGAFAPDATAGNEERAISARITTLQEQAKAFEMTPFHHQVMKEFVELLIPYPHELAPQDLDHLMEKQAKPSQRSILANATGLTLRAAARVSSFIKKEAYGEPTDPRVISTIGPTLKHDYSLFIYAFTATIMYHQPWYAFSNTPAENADRMCAILAHALTAAMTDFSRFDGRMDAFARALELACLLRAFKPQYHSEIIELHQSTFNLKGVGRFGTKYNTLFTRASGESGTSVFNTLVNAFVNYMAKRMERDGSGFCNPERAWLHLSTKCLFGGDDGAVGDPPATLTSAAKAMNHVLTIDLVKRGDWGVTFLSRQFGPDVWYGDNNSTCDVPRQLAKFHTSPNLPAHITPAQKLAEKAYSFFLTDSNTPIIGDYVTKVMSIMKPEPSNHALDNIRRWGDDVPKENQWPNEPRNWYTESLLRNEKLHTLAWGVFERYIEHATTVTQLLQPPLLVEITRSLPKATAVVDGELIHVPPRPKKGRRRAHA